MQNLNAEQIIKVSSERFYQEIGQKDVILEVVEPFPYKIDFKLRRSGKVVGYQDRDSSYYVMTSED